MRSTKIYVKPNTRMRVVIATANQYKPVFWIKVGLDGSVYTSSTFKNPTFAVSASEEEDMPAFNIKHGSERVTRKKSDLLKAKLTFHPSGKIHDALSRGKSRPEFWTHLGLDLLCYIQLENPEGIQQGHPRKTDLVINIGNSKNLLKIACPITCNILLSNSTLDGLPLLNTLPEKHYVLIFKNFKDARKEDMCVHLIFNNVEEDFFPYTLYSYPRIVRSTVTYHHSGNGITSVDMD